MLDGNARAEGLPITGGGMRVCLEGVLRDRISAPMTLFTFGYEGLSIEAFIARFDANDRHFGEAKRNGRVQA